jgi:hypothetical protein
MLVTTEIIVRISMNDNLRGKADVEKYLSAIRERLAQGEIWGHIEAFEALGFMCMEKARPLSATLD